MQLNASTCARFDSGAFSAPHPSDDDGKLACDIQSSTSTARCPALVVLTRNQGRNRTRQFPPGNGSALWDPSTACTARSTSIDAGGKHFALWVRARLLWRHGPFTHRRNRCGARRAARARQKEQRGFLMLSGRRTRGRRFALAAPMSIRWVTSRLERRCNQLSHKQPWMATK